MHVDYLAPTTKSLSEFAIIVRSSLPLGGHAQACGRTEFTLVQRPTSDVDQLFRRGATAGMLSV